MQIFGLLGRSLSHSLSPRLHNLLYEHTGIDASYNIFEIEPDAIKNVISAAKILGIKGLNVTIPYKRNIMPYIDTVDPCAESLGAVNTVLFDNGKTSGFNTDYYGFPMSLQHGGIEISGKRFLLCGMSGAGRAVYRSLIDNGAAEVLVASTDPAKGMSYSSLPDLPQMDVIVNCTPVGMYPHMDKCAVDDCVFDKFHTAVDIVYNPVETLFLKKASNKGLKTLSGLYMLIFQGIKSFELWTGIEPQPSSVDIIFKTLIKELTL